MVDSIFVNILRWIHLSSFIITVAILGLALYITYSTKNILNEFTDKIASVQKILAYYVLMILVNAIIGFLFSLSVFSWDFLGPVSLINDSGFLIKILSIVVLFTLVSTLHRIIRVKLEETTNGQEFSDDLKIESLQTIFRLEFYSILILFFLLFTTIVL
jgi:hypothetical protein